METANRNDYLVLVNTNAGGKRAEKDWPEIEALLTNSGLTFKVVFTKHHLHAIELTREFMSQGYRNFIAVGGDGTINEVVNGICMFSEALLQEVKLGVIMIGTGNDWGKMFNIPNDYAQAVELIKKQNIHFQDVGKTSFFKGDDKIDRYFINAAGIGFDALVVERVNKAKDKGNASKLAYLQTLFTSLIKYKSTKARIKIGDDNWFHSNIFTMSVGIGKFCGGGMQQVPDAIDDDGLFDVTLVNQIRKTKIVRKIKKLYDGTIKEMKEIDSFRARKVEVDSSVDLLLQVDGESLGHAPFTFEIIENRLGILVNKV